MITLLLVSFQGRPKRKLKCKYKITEPKFTVMPRSRQKAMEEGLRSAIMVPLSLAQTVTSLWDPIKQLVEVYYLPTTSDLQVSVHCLRTAVYAAAYNVEINLKMDEAKHLRAEVSMHLWTFNLSTLTSIDDGGDQTTHWDCGSECQWHSESCRATKQTEFEIKILPFNYSFYISDDGTMGLVGSVRGCVESWPFVLCLCFFDYKITKKMLNLSNFGSVLKVGWNDGLKQGCSLAHNRTLVPHAHSQKVNFCCCCSQGSMMPRRD